MGTLYRYHLLLYNIHYDLPVSMKNSMILLSFIFESTVSIHMQILFQKIKKCITNLCMHTSQTQDLWLWPKCPPSAFSVAEMSVANMSEHRTSIHVCIFLKDLNPYFIKLFKN